MPASIWGSGSASPFFSNTNLYGGQQSMWGAPIVSGNGQSLMNQNPQAAFARFTSPYAGGQDAFSRFTQNQFNNVNRGFQAAQMTNPDLRFDNYFNSLGGRNFFQKQFMNVAARDRGFNQPAFGGGRMTWFPGV
jgi:hypothetical protein